MIPFSTRRKTRHRQGVPPKSILGEHERTDRCHTLPHIMCRVDILVPVRTVILLVVAAETHSAITAFSRAWPITFKPIALQRKSQRVIIVTKSQS